MINKYYCKDCGKEFKKGKIKMKKENLSAKINNVISSVFQDAWIASYEDCINVSDKDIILAIIKELQKLV